MRNFGVEIELNSFDNRDFSKNPLQTGEFPEGFFDVVDSISSIGFDVEPKSWHYTHNNTNWIVKTDSSCGIEICSPVFDNTDSVIRLLNHLKKEKFKANNSCSFHIHFDFLNNSNQQVASVLSWWVKVEHLIFDCLSKNRKCNSYCKSIGFSDIFNHDYVPSKDIIYSLGKSKYYSANAFHLVRNSRRTLEFRIFNSKEFIDSPIDFSYWVLFLNKFIEASISKGIPSNLCWVDLEELLALLNLKKEKLFWFLSKMSRQINKKSLFRSKSLDDLKKIFVEKSNLMKDK